jgi:hypothetical protein
MTEKFDYIILNEDNEWLSTGYQKTQEQLEEDLAIIQKEQLDRWGEDLPLVVFKAPNMETKTILGKQIIF